MKHRAIKISVFALLLGLFYVCEGFDLPHGAFDTSIYFKHNPVVPWVLIILCSIYGAVVAVWSDKTRGIIHPVSFRSGYIMLGIVQMQAALLITFFVRFIDDRQPDNPIAVIAVRSAIADPAARKAWFSFSDSRLAHLNMT